MGKLLGRRWLKRSNSKIFKGEGVISRMKLLLIGVCSLFALLDSVIAQTWTQSTNAPNGSWTSIAASADGSKLVAGTSDPLIYVSTNSGANWVQDTNGDVFSIGGNWTSLASSADGTKLVATVFQGYIFTSIDSGLHWHISNSDSEDWSSVASSADGTELMATELSGYIYGSTNSGLPGLKPALPVNIGAISRPPLTGANWWLRLQKIIPIFREESIPRPIQVRPGRKQGL